MSDPSISQPLMQLAIRYQAVQAAAKVCTASNWLKLCLLLHPKVAQEEMFMNDKSK